MVRYPPLVLSFTQAHLCDTPWCNVSRDNCAIPPQKQARNSFAILSLQVSRDMKSIAAGPLSSLRKHGWGRVLPVGKHGPKAFAHESMIEQSKCSANPSAVFCNARIINSFRLTSVAKGAEKVLCRETVMQWVFLETPFSCVRGLLGKDSPDPIARKIRFRPPLQQGSIWHRFDIEIGVRESGNRCRINVESMLNRCQIDPWGGKGEENRDQEWPEYGWRT